MKEEKLKITFPDGNTIETAKKHRRVGTIEKYQRIKQPGSCNAPEQ